MLSFMLLLKMIRSVFNAKGEEILTVEISLIHHYYEKYIFLVNNPYIIACQDDIKKLDDIFIRHWLNSLVVERFQTKSESILKIFSETGNDWEETFYRLLTRYFGFRVNTEPFEMLATALPFKIIRNILTTCFRLRLFYLEQPVCSKQDFLGKLYLMNITVI